MKKILFSFFLLLNAQLHAQLNYAWHHAYNGTGNQEATAIWLSPNGEIFESGYFTNSVGSMTSVGGKDAAHLLIGTGSGSTPYGGTGDDIGRRFKRGNGDYVYACGEFNGTVDFNSYLYAINYGLSPNNRGAYVVKNLHPSGSYSFVPFQWVRTITPNNTNSWVNVNDMYIGPNDDIYICGSFWGTVNFPTGGSGGIGGNRSSSSYAEDVFIAKYDASGLCLWISIFQAGANTYYVNPTAKALDMDAHGNLYVVGELTSYYFNLNAPSGTSWGDKRDPYIAKLNSNNGNTISYARFRDENQGYGSLNDIKIFNHKIYVTGSYNSFYFNAGSSNALGGNPDYFSYNMFVAAYDTNLVFQWANHSNSGNGVNEVGSCIDVDSYGNVYVGVNYSGNCDVNGNGPTAAPLTSAGGWDFAIVRYSNTGAYQFSSKFGGTGADDIRDIAVNPNNGDIYIAGTNTNVLDIDPTSATQNMAFTAGTEWYTAKFTLNTPLPLQWKTFEATDKQTAVSLDWSTLNETNCDQFIVEASYDAHQWKTIETVKAHNEMYNRYQSIDDETFSGTKYYRIQQVDMDGKTSYSSTQLVQRNRPTSIQLFPNPTANYLHINVRTDAQVQLYAMSGQLIYTTTLQAQQSLINLQHLLPGMYFIRVSTTDEILNTTIQKL